MTRKPLYPLYTPTAVGHAALDELSHVPWSKLAFAYHYREHPGLAHDVEATLRAFSAADWDPAFVAIYSNVVHQRTVYETTAYAVPFIAALIAGPATTPTLRLGLTILLTDIALSSSFETEDGGSAGAYGEGVADLIRSALLDAKPRFDAIAALAPELADVFPTILAIATDPTKGAFNDVLAHTKRLNAQFRATDDES